MEPLRPPRKTLQTKYIFNLRNENAPQASCPHRLSSQPFLLEQTPHHSRPGVVNYPLPQLPTYHLFKAKEASTGQLTPLPRFVFHVHPIFIPRSFWCRDAGDRKPKTLCTNIWTTCFNTFQGHCKCPENIWSQQILLPDTIAVLFLHDQRNQANFTKNVNRYIVCFVF